MVGPGAGSGGTIQLLGRHVGLSAASIDASGTAGGGTVLIGGDYQGRNPAIQNAAATYVGPNATLVADAVTSGKGGKVIVWADDVTRFRGNISARDGAQGGDGGFAEVSGKKHLTFDGQVDLRAPGGKTGTLLLDPNNITIQDAGPNLNGDGAAGDDLASASIVFADFGTNNSIITTGQVVTQLAAANVLLQATNDITVAAAIDASAKTADNSLTLQAGHDVIINAALTSNGGGSLILLAVNDVKINAALTASAVSGTAIELSAGHDLTIGAALTANGVAGAVVLRSDNDGTGPGLAGGTVTFASGGVVSVPATSIRFNPVAYTTTGAEILAYQGKISGGTEDVRAWTFINNASATAQGKIYDRTTTATLSAPFAFKSGPDGVTAGQQVSLSAGAANFSDKNVGAAKAVNFTGYGLGGSDEPSYALFSQPASQTAAISAKALTITGFATDDKVYNSKTAAVIGSVGTLSGVEPGDAVGFSHSGATFDTKNVGTGKTVTLNGVTLTGSGDQGNYVYLAPTTDVSAITPATLMVTVGMGDHRTNHQAVAVRTLPCKRRSVGN